MQTREVPLYSRITLVSVAQRQRRATWNVGNFRLPLHPVVPPAVSYDTPILRFVPEQPRERTTARGRMFPCSFHPQRLKRKWARREQPPIACLVCGCPGCSLADCRGRLRRGGCGVVAAARAAWRRARRKRNSRRGEGTSEPYQTSRSTQLLVVRSTRLSRTSRLVCIPTHSPCVGHIKPA